MEMAFLKQTGLWPASMRRRQLSNQEFSGSGGFGQRIAQGADQAVDLGRVLMKGGASWMVSPP
jgi:hypothetical protein